MLALVYPILLVKNDAMNPSRLVFFIVAGVFLSWPQSLRADAPPFTPDKQFSADQVITTKSGMTVACKIYMNDGKARSEMNTQDMQVISIVRPDEKKMFMVMPSQKMVMVMNLDEKTTAQINAATGDDGKFETVGPETMDGVACTKYKMTTKDNKVFFWWVNTATKAPVKIAADDGSITLDWKNYKAGPQDPALFEPPKDYQTVAMPGGGGMPGAADGQ